MRVSCIMVIEELFPVFYRVNHCFFHMILDKIG